MKQVVQSQQPQGTKEECLQEPLTHQPCGMDQGGRDCATVMLRGWADGLLGKVLDTREREPLLE